VGEAALESDKSSLAIYLRDRVMVLASISKRKKDFTAAILDAIEREGIYIDKDARAPLVRFLSRHTCDDMLFFLLAAIILQERYQDSRQHTTLLYFDLPNPQAEFVVYLKNKKRVILPLERAEDYVRYWRNKGVDIAISRPSGKTNLIVTITRLLEEVKE
jgi:hypothetical protein